MKSEIIEPTGCLTGGIEVPGDKSISHRVLMLASLADGESRIHGLSKGQDVKHTMEILSSLGVQLDEIESDVLHIWPRGNFMLIALPNMDKSFTCTLFMPSKGATSFETIKTSKEVNDLFKTYFPDILDLIPTLHDDYIKNPTGNLATIYLDPWHFDNRALLIGDAAHAIVPFFGQGMNASFQDCTTLNKLIKKEKNDWGSIFSTFSKQHVVNGHAIADMAIENYEEMRDSVNKTSFQAQRKLEFSLEKQFPNKFIPRYSMVSFSERPYSEVYNKGEKQYKLLNALLEIDPSGNTINSDIVDKIIN